MNFGFDIDGTITAALAPLVQIAQALISDGHEVHVLTGTMDPGNHDEHHARRVAQLDELGFPYTHLRVVHAPHHVRAKAEYCHEHRIELMFEDSAEYAAAIRAVDTTVVMVGG